MPVAQASEPAARASGPARPQRKSKQARMQTGPLPVQPNARILRNTSATSGLNKTSALIDHPSDNQPPTSQLPEDIPDDVSHTLTSSNRDSTSPVINVTPAGEMLIDEDEEVLPATTAAPGAPCDSMIQVKFIPTLGVSALVETSPPTLLFIDKDERPGWLLTAVREFLKNGPYYLCLNKVVDLFLNQEARLGYPVKVSNFRFLWVFSC